MPELTLQETQAITELAEALYSFLPASAYPYSKPKVDFGTVARDIGIGNLWPGGSKLPAIQTLLEATLRTKRDRFCPLMIRITKEGLKYRNKKGIPITQEEMNRLNQLIVGVVFKIPELVDPNFISSLPKAKLNSTEIRKDETASSKISPEKIESIKQRFLQMEKLKPQERGYEFEKLLYDLFDIYGFNPRPSFRNTGEQIDGSIEFEHQFYLIEARWQTNPIPEKDLLALHGRASGHSRIGRGIFITCGNFSADGVYAFQRLQPTSIIGFDGQDLYIIFENRLSLADVIRLKVRKLVESGEFHYPVLKLIPEILNAKKQ
ncbi:Restriction endonuclease [uncultured archaeon]|nr:Restriction endonuclease [uncultured archaeon]